MDQGSDGGGLGVRLVPKGRLNVIMGVCGLFQIDKSILKPVCMKNLVFWGS